MITATSLEAWLPGQESASIAGLAACLSCSDLVFERPGFGQTIRPRPGSTVASPSIGIGPGEPDYFFHWIRDSALFLNAVAVLIRGGDRSRDWPRFVHDFVTFSLTLNGGTGSSLVTDRTWRTLAQPAFTQFLRTDTELTALSPKTLAGDVRSNPDGTIDVIRWSRPQHDGPALRALACLRLTELDLGDGEMSQLIDQDLDYTLRHASSPSVDIWEDVTGDHYYTRLVQFAALAKGAAWARPDIAAACREAAAALSRHLEKFAVPAGHFVWSLGEPTPKHLDTQIILGILHAGITEGAHSVLDPRAAATLDALEAVAAEDYPLNHRRPAGTGVALGRYRGDHYVSAGPWYLTTFAAAEFRYRRAAGTTDPALKQRLIIEGDASLEAAKHTIPASGAMTEQFDPATGAQTSARDLGWSHAAFLTALAGRRQAIAGKKS